MLSGCFLTATDRRGVPKWDLEVGTGAHIMNFYSAQTSFTLGISDSFLSKSLEYATFNCSPPFTTYGLLPTDRWKYTEQEPMLSNKKSRNGIKFCTEVMAASIFRWMEVLDWLSNESASSNVSTKKPGSSLEPSTFPLNA